jgi:Na+-translocating ferredoxin:NAD+ oxidoreductase RnfD subunit
LPRAEHVEERPASSSRWQLHARRWLRSPKGLFTLLLGVLTIPAAMHTGWALVMPGLLAAIAAAMCMDAPLIKWRDGTWSMPDGAMLTGWLVGVILSPHVPWIVAAGSAALAIAAKHVLRVKRANVFNPAAAGLVASYYLFDSGQNWWGALPELSLPWLLLLVGTAGFMAWRLNKLALVLSFLGVHFTLGTIAAYWGNPALVAELFRAPDVHMALFFAGFMATDPPTSPPRPADQLVYGSLAAVASFTLFMAVGAVYFLLGGLLVANLWEGWRKWKRVNATRTRLPSTRAGWTTTPTGT